MLFTLGEGGVSRHGEERRIHDGLHQPFNPPKEPDETLVSSTFTALWRYAVPIVTTQMLNSCGVFTNMVHLLPFAERG
jgi:hypothetical protein